MSDKKKTMPKEYYSYAVNDPSYPGEPEFWSCEDFTLGNANNIGWGMDLRSTAIQGTSSLLSRLKEKQNYLTLCIAINGTTTEPKITPGSYFDQLFIGILEAETGYTDYKLGFYHINVEKITITPPNAKFYQTKNILCKVVRGGYVAGNRK